MQEFPLVEVSGTSFHMGLQHGKQAEPLIRKYLIWIQKLTGVEIEVLRANAMRFLPYIQRLSPAYVEEIFGQRKVREFQLRTPCCVRHAPRRRKNGTVVVPRSRLRGKLPRMARSSPARIRTSNRSMPT